MSGFVEDPKFAENLSKQPQMRNVLMDKARRVIKLAAVLVAYDTGYFARTLDTDWDAKKRRAIAMSRDMYGGRVIEFGGPNNVAQAPLRRAADVICDGFQRTPKPGNP